MNYNQRIASRCVDETTPCGASNRKVNIIRNAMFITFS